MKHGTRNEWVYQYTIIHQDTALQLPSPLTPEELVTFLKRLRNLFQSADVDDLSIYVETGRAIAVEHKSPELLESSLVDNLIRELRQRQAEDEDLQDKFQVIGARFLKTYKLWKCQHHLTPGAPSASSARSMHERDILMLDAIISSLPDFMQEIFELRILKQFTVEQTIRTLHVSQATFHRQMRNLKRRIGMEIVACWGNDVADRPPASCPATAPLTL